jgi:WS/DGAT/MGAT family acyltransferase
MPVRFEYGERMSETDALLWNNERDPMLRSTILSLLLLDRAPDEARFHAAIDRALARIPRLRQRVVLDPLGAAPPRWALDERFDRAYHVRRVGAPGKGSLRELLDFAAPIVMQAFDKDRPLWELYLADGLEQGRQALLMKLHHSVTDGVGLVRMTSSLVERTCEGEPSRASPPRSVEEEAELVPERGPFEEALAAVRYRAGADFARASRLSHALREGASDLVLHPKRALRRGVDLAGSVARLLRPVSRPLSPLLTGRSLAVRFDAFSRPLAELKRAGKSTGGTLNDAFVAAVAGGLRLYHERHGHTVRELRMTMPINLRDAAQGGRAGNEFAPARLRVPIGIADPAERMRAIRSRVAAQRAEPALPISAEIAGLLGRLPRALAVPLFGSMLKAIDFVTSNVPGPPFPVYVSGARVEQMWGYGPLSGAAANVTAFSYDGELAFGVSTDPAAVRDPDLFVECLERGVAEVLSVA